MLQNTPIVVLVEGLFQNQKCETVHNLGCKRTRFSDAIVSRHQQKEGNGTRHESGVIKVYKTEISAVTMKPTADTSSLSPEISAVVNYPKNKVKFEKKLGVNTRKLQK